MISMENPLTPPGYQPPVPSPRPRGERVRVRGSSPASHNGINVVRRFARSLSEIPTLDRRQPHGPTNGTPRPNPNKRVSAGTFPNDSFLSFLLSIVVLLMLAAPVSAQQLPLTIESSSMQPSLVLGRPMLTWWTVKIQSSGLVTGKFKFVIKNDRELLATTETEELTLNGPEQRIRVMLPTIDSLFLIDQLQVDISFHGKTASGSLGQHVLHVPFVKKRVFIGLSAESSLIRKNSAQREKLIDGLRFENVVPESKANRSAEDDREYLKTIFASIDPSDLPSEPLAYCSYDIVIAAGDEFRNLRKPQLEALLAWIKSGGSLYVEPHGVLEPYHVEFLRNLVADDHNPIVFHLDQAGKLVNDFIPRDRPGVSVECGLGHSAIRLSDSLPEIDAANEAWRAIARPLWNSRLQPIEVTRDPEMLRRNGIAQQIIGTNTDSFSLAQTLSTRSRLSQKELLERLMPEGVRMVPLSYLALILTVFVILIGPFDYLVLGWLRMRKLTWLTFPMTTFCITGLTVCLSNSYMSTAETRRAIVIRDLGPGGDVVRTNRIELLYIASSRQVMTPIEKAFFAPLKAGYTSTDPGVPTIDSRAVEFDVTSTQIQGRIPTEYEVTQNLTKWTPQMNRIFSIPGTSEKPNVDWHAFQLRASDAFMFHKHVVPLGLTERVHESFGPRAIVACFTGNAGWAANQSTEWQSRQVPPATSLNARTYYLGSNALDHIPEIRSAREVGMPDFFIWLYAMSVGFPGSGIYSPTSGMYALINHTAPTGSASCHDLTLLDSSDPNAWLLVIIVPGKDDSIVYRKLMRFN